MITAAAAGAATFFPPISSFHRQRLRPCPRRLTFVHPARATGSSSSSSEEARWLREEQRWQREEQRWLREESRWRAEREALLAELAALRLRLCALEGPPPHDRHFAEVEAVASPAPHAAVPALQPRPVLVGEVEVTKEVVAVEEKTKAASPKADESGAGGMTNRRRTLRTGSEGEDVRAMQVSIVAGLSFWLGLGFVAHDVCLSRVVRHPPRAVLSHPMLECRALYSLPHC
jgi:protein disulfide-isomerase